MGKWCTVVAQSIKPDRNEQIVYQISLSIQPDRHEQVVNSIYPKYLAR